MESADFTLTVATMCRWQMHERNVVRIWHIGTLQHFPYRRKLNLLGQGLEYWHHLSKVNLNEISSNGSQLFIAALNVFSQRG